MKNDSIFLANLHHAYAKTDGIYAFPNSREGDMLKTAKREIETLRTELDIAQKFYRVAVAERDFARFSSDTKPDLEFDPEIRATYVRLSHIQIVRQEVLKNGQIILDLAADGSIVGVEIFPYPLKKDEN